jgi:hypothetical protein
MPLTKFVCAIVLEVCLALSGFVTVCLWRVLVCWGLDAGELLVISPG